MSDLRSFTPVEPNTAGKALIAVQTVVTKIKELIVGSVAKGVNKDEITRQLNKLISDFCKTIDNEALREQNRKALVTAAKKWYYTTTTTFEIVNRNLLSMSSNIYRIGANDLTSHITELRPQQDRGINLGTPLIADYKRSVRLAMKALAADPPLVVTRRDGKTYTMPIRNRAEIAVRYDANVKDLQKFANSGVDLVWTSQHPNCSPRCKDYQGKLWSISGKSGKINGITYRPLSEAIQGKLKDGNGIITGYNCRHRLIEYTSNSHPPQELSEAEIKKEYAIDKKQRSYENNIRQMKTNERLLRATGDIEGAKALRKRWRRATKLYQAYSFENNRPFYPDRCVIDEVEIKDKKESMLSDEEQTFWRQKISDYTDGRTHYYYDLNNVAEHILYGKKLFINQDESYDKLQNEAKRFIKAIKDSPTSKELYRIEGRPTVPNYKVGDTIQFGIKSTSSDKEWIDKVLNDEDEGIVLKNHDDERSSCALIFNIKGKKHALDIAKYSEYKSQNEYLISGEYQVDKISVKDNYAEWEESQKQKAIFVKNAVESFEQDLDKYNLKKVYSSKGTAGVIINGNFRPLATKGWIENYLTEFYHYNPFASFDNYGQKAIFKKDIYVTISEKKTTQ